MAKFDTTYLVFGRAPLLPSGVGLCVATALRAASLCSAPLQSLTREKEVFLWRVPSQSDWDELIVFLETAGHTGQVADVLKNNIGWENDGNGRNLYGFNALPGGFRESLGAFKDQGLSGYWWSSSPGGAAGAQGYLMDGGNTEIGQFPNFNRKAGFSVRCIKN